MMRTRGLVAAIGFSLTVVAARADAQATITVGASANVAAAPGSALTIPIVADMSGAPGGTISTLGAGLSWNPAVFRLDSIRAAGVGVVTSSVTAASTGNATFSVTGLPSGLNVVPIANVYLTTAATAGGTRLYIFPTLATNARGTVRLGQLVSRHADVCVTLPGIWGDANGDGSVNIIDAQQIARAVVGLSVASAPSVASFGDVNGDGAVDILDAQQIARFSIGLPAAARIGTYVSPKPEVASVVTSLRSSLVLGGATTLVATPRDAAGAALTGCAVASFTSSDPATVSVNSSGGLRGLKSGSATVTVAAGTQSVQVPLTVPAGPDSVSALLHLRNVTAAGPSSFTESSWVLGGLLADEWRSGDTFSQRNDMDQRAVQDRDLLAQGMLSELFLARGDARVARASLTAAAAPPEAIAHMYFAAGYAELLLAETFCNGVVLDESSPLVVSGAALSNAELYARAITQFDSALAIAPASAPIANLTRIAKARALVNQGNLTSAAALVTNVPTSYQFLIVPGPGESNKNWLLNNQQFRLGVSDSVDPSGVLQNALPFVSAADPRVPQAGYTQGFDGTTRIALQGLWTRASAVTPLLSGIDARLIEAEARLSAGDFTGMTNILNALRAAPQNLGSVTTPVMAPLAVPSSQAAAISLLFRERAFWTFGRGQRLGDLRRLIRLYGRTEATVFPTGTFFKGGAYGRTTNFPAAVDEQGNVLATVCTDRNP